MEFTLKYAKNNNGLSISIYGQQGQIPRDQLLNYMSQDASFDALAIFDATQNNPQAPSQYLVKSSVTANNRIEGFDKDFPLVMEWISEQFIAKKATNKNNPILDTEIARHVKATLTKQEMRNHLRFIAQKHCFSTIHTTKLNMVLDSFLADIKTESIDQPTWNNVVKTHSSKPMLVHWIDRQFEELNVSIPLAPRLTKQTLITRLKSHAKQSGLDDHDEKALGAALKSILADADGNSISRTEWKRVAKKHASMPVVYQFKTLDAVKNFLKQHHHELIKELPEFVKTYDEVDFPTNENKLIELSDKSSFVIVNNQQNETTRYLQLIVETKQQSSLEYFLSWMTWTSPERHLQNHQPTEHLSFFDLLETGQKTWEIDAKQQQQRNMLLRAGITALIALPGLAYSIHKINDARQAQEKLEPLSLNENIFNKNDAGFLQNKKNNVTLAATNSCQLVTHPGISQASYQRASVKYNPFDLFWISASSNCSSHDFRISIEIESSIPGIFVQDQVHVCSATTVNYNGTIASGSCVANPSILRDIIHSIWVVPPENLINSYGSLPYEIKVNFYSPQFSSNLVDSINYKFELFKTRLSQEQPYYSLRPNQLAYALDDVNIDGDILPNEAISITPSPTAPIINIPLPNFCNYTGGANGVEFPWTLGKNQIVSCSHNTGFKSDLNTFQTYLVKYTLKGVSPTSYTEATIEKEIEIKPFDLSGTLFQANKFCRYNIPCLLFSYTDPQKIYEIFPNENFNITSNQKNTAFSALPAGNNIWAKTPYGVTNGGEMLTPDGLTAGLNSLEATIKRPTSVISQLSDTNNQNVTSKSFHYGMADTDFTPVNDIHFSESGVTHISGKNTLSARGNVVLLSNEILVLKGSILPFLKEDSCPFEIGESDSTRTIKGPLTITQFNNCINSLAFTKPKGILNSLHDFDLQGDIIHSPSGQSVNIGFSIKFKFDFENFANEIGYGTAISAILSIVAIKSYYKSANQKYANWIKTHPYGEKAHLQLAFLMKTPPILYDESTNLRYKNAVDALRNKVDEQLNQGASSSTIQQSTANSYGFDFILAINIILDERLREKQAVTTSPAWTTVRSKFTSKQPKVSCTMEMIALLIEIDLSNAQDDLNNESVLAKAIINLLPQIQQHDKYNADDLKILRQAEKLFNEGFPVSYSTARNACYRLPASDSESQNSNHITPPEGTILAPNGITVIPPRSAVRAGNCISQNAHTAWNALPSGGAVKGTAIYVVTANHCCGFFSRSSQQNYEPINESSQGTPLLPTGLNSG